MVICKVKTTGWLRVNTNMFPRKANALR
uniref:Uncharacterized protein n=1 Tax=Stomoxys calcitrans TaxID=35570 RepID=A0A1I8Q3V4_STOCA